MSYLGNVEWTIIPDSKPEVRRHCPKCGEKTHYVNTEKFRVNANKNKLDIWLIYQCSKCKSTWNLSIYERINPEKLQPEEYEKFLANDNELAIRYGFDISLHNKKNAELMMDFVDYHVISKNLIPACRNESDQEIRIHCPYPIQIRVDKLLSEQWKLSRNQIKSMCLDGFLFSLQDKDLWKTRIYDGMVIHLISIQMTKE